MKKAVLFICMIVLAVSIVGCSPRARGIEKLVKVEEMDQFHDYSGFRVEEGRFYFTAIEEGMFNAYSMDIKTREITQLFSQIQLYDSFIPLEDKDAIYVDQDGTLYHYQNGEAKKIDENISGFNTPNLMVALNRDMALYTKGTHEVSDLFLYVFQDEEPQLVVSNISETSYKDFHFMTQWSTSTGYFIFDNRIYNSSGESIASLNATSTKWAPNDDYIAYIEMPEDQEAKSIIIGDWNTYIGDKLVLFNLQTGEHKILLESQYGLIDPIDSIQWNKESNKVAMLEGEIKLQQGVLDGIDYQQISLYDLEGQDLYEVTDIKDNYYEILFDDLIYTKQLGRKSPLRLIPVEEGKRKSFEEPLILNNKSMFVIQQDEVGYLIDGQDLVEIYATGDTKKLMKLPFDPLAMYLNEKNQQLIIINRELEMYLYQL